MRDGFMNIKVSIGEVVDKYTILEIKLDHARDVRQIRNIIREYDYLKNKVDKLKVSLKLIEALKVVNMTMWEIEDEIRQLEAKKDFSDKFIQLARAVYKNNDQRSKIKKKINEQYGSEFVEEKILPKYEKEVKK